MGWLIALGVLILLAILPLGVSVIYNADGPLVRLIAGPIRIKLFPAKKKGPKKEKKPKEKKNEEKKEEKQPKPEPKEKKLPAEKRKDNTSGGSVLDFLPLVQIAFDFLRDFKWKLRLNRLELKVILGGGDPCDLAVNYGRAWAALGNLIPRMEEFFVIKKRDTQVECDFTADSTVIFARLDISITLGRIIGLAVCYGVRALRAFLKIMKKRKGGAKL